MPYVPKGTCPREPIKSAFETTSGMRNLHVYSYYLSTNIFLKKHIEVNTVQRNLSSNILYNRRHQIKYTHFIRHFMLLHFIFENKHARYIILSGKVNQSYTDSRVL